MNAFEIENLMDNEIETHHHEGEMPVHVVAKLGDGLPAFGIVAAVMGVVLRWNRSACRGGVGDIDWHTRWSAPSSVFCWRMVLLGPLSGFA